MTQILKPERPVQNTVGVLGMKKKGLIAISTGIVLVVAVILVIGSRNLEPADQDS